MLHKAISTRFEFKFLLLGGMLCSLAITQTAVADVIPLSYSATASGTIGTGSITPLVVPGSHTYGHTLSALTTPVYTTPSGQTFEFYDNYIFTISGATSNSLTSSINLGTSLGLDNFQVRLYELGANPVLPVFGTPAGGTLLEGWSTPITFSPGLTGLIGVIPEHVLSAGSYVLEVRGNVNGTSGGSYSGVLNLTPVPVPAAIWLILSGLGGLAAFRRRV